MDIYEILKMAKQFCIELLVQRLAKDLYFHDLSHTTEVAEACFEIGTDSGLSAEELAIVCIAAWFHDTGYCNTYRNHEIESVNIAVTFLNLLGTEERIVKSVTGCILATKIPQQPSLLIEKIICDADFYHFSRANYREYEQALKKEWEVHLKLFYTDQDWNEANYEVLTKHSYFTYYGQQVLQPRKEENIKKIAADT